ncbi:MAG: recombinase family protein [Eubacteriales bacterium]|nr:recombinase family protein [Eubacteriales bacterium]
MPKYKAAKYVRLSYTDDKENESDSIINQKKLIDEFVKGNPDIEIVNERVDDGYSGIVFDRPAFKQMMQDIKNGVVNCVIVKDLSRLGREYIETGRYLKRIFPALGVRFIAINDNIDTLREAAADDLSVSFRSIINDEYCRDISVKVRSALNAKRRNGDYVGACTVYGYKKSEENKNRLVVDEYAANIIRDIFKMRIEGMSAARIADELNRMAVLSPIEYKKNNNLPHPHGGYTDKKNARWSATTIIRILKDEIYTGTLIQGKQGTPNYKIKELVTRAKDDWFITENAHEAIISKNDFVLVNRLMNIDTRISPLKNRLHLFSGILVCGGCGNRMTRKTVTYKGNKYFYYYCPTGEKNGCNASNMIKESDLIKCVTDSVKAHIGNVASLNDLINTLSQQNINHELVKKYTMQISDLNRQLEKCKDFKSQLYENFVQGVLDKADYRTLKHRYNEESKRLSDAISELENEIDECMSNTSQKLKWLEYFRQFENISEIDRKIVVQLISSIHIIDKKTLQITFNYADEYKKALSDLEEVKEAM